MLAYVLTSNGVSGVINGKSFSFDNSHINYQKLVDALKSKDEISLEKYLDVVESVNRQAKTLNTKIEIIGDTVYYDGSPLHSSLTAKLIHMLKDGFDIKPL